MKNRREGVGIEVYPNKMRFEGEWKSDQYHGAGMLTLSNGVQMSARYKAGECVEKEAIPSCSPRTLSATSSSSSSLSSSSASLIPFSSAQVADHEGLCCVIKRASHWGRSMHSSFHCFPCMCVLLNRMQEAN